MPEYKVTFFDEGQPVVNQVGSNYEVVGFSSQTPTVEDITQSEPPPSGSGINDIVYRTPFDRNTSEHLWESATPDLQVVYDRAVIDTNNSDIMRHCLGSLKIDSNGDIYVSVMVRDEHSAPSVYEGAGYVVIKSTDDGSSWEEVSRVDMGGDTKKPNLVPINNGLFNLVIQQKGDNAGASWENPLYPPNSYCMSLQGQLLSIHSTFSSNNKIRKFYASPIPSPNGSQLLYDRESKRWFETSDGGETLVEWPATQQLRGPIQNETAAIFQGTRLWCFARNESINYVDPPYEGANSWVEVLAQGATHGHGGLDCIEYNGKVYLATRKHYDEGGTLNTYWVLLEVSLSEPYGYTEVLRIDNVGSDGGYSSLAVHNGFLYCLYDAVPPNGWTSAEHVPWVIKLAAI